MEVIGQDPTPDPICDAFIQDALLLDKPEEEKCGEYGEGYEEKPRKVFFGEGAEDGVTIECMAYWKSDDYTTCYTLERSNKRSKRKEKEPEKVKCPVEKVERRIANYNANPDGINQTINYEKFNSLPIYDHYVENIENPESAFYILCDSWKEEVITLTLAVSNRPPSKNASNTSGNLGNEEKGRKRSKAMITVNVQPWDWRNDLCLQPPIVSLETRNQGNSLFTTTKGRNTFRLFVGQNYPEITNGERDGEFSGGVSEDEKKWMEKDRKENLIPFTVRVCSNFPFMIGTKEKILLYMTNPPVILLKQTQMICDSLWLLVLGAWRSKEESFKGLKCLRNSYCPSYNKKLVLNKDNKGNHELFEELFYVVVAKLSGDLFDHWLVLTLRALFLNPRLGIGALPYHHIHLHGSGCYSELYQEKGKLPNNVLSAIVTIQRYFRGWQTRQVIKPGPLNGRINYWTKSHEMIERCLKVMAHLFEKSTEEPFLNAKESEGAEGLQGEEEPVKNPIPNPPKWAFYLFNKLLEGHPWLHTIHQFDFCTPQHLEIQEIEGYALAGCDYASTMPFYKQTFLIPKGIRTFYVHIELTSKGMKDLKMKIVNNDTFEKVKLVPYSNTLFVGRLHLNTFGYSVNCYKSKDVLPDPTAEDKFVCLYEEWRLKFCHAAIQPGPCFVNDKNNL